MVFLLGLLVFYRELLTVSEITHFNIRACCLGWGGMESGKDL